MIVGENCIFIYLFYFISVQKMHIVAFQMNKLRKKKRIKNSSIEIQFKNNWICNEILSITFFESYVSSTKTTCWNFHEFFIFVLGFFWKFSHIHYISSLNYAMDVKICHQLHKLARKSDELIPPAHHSNCFI